MTTHHTSGAADLPEALRNATIIRDWCTDCRIPLPSDDECARLVAALAAGQAVAPKYVGNGMFEGETIHKAAEHWANWCDRRMLDGLAEFLRVEIGRASCREKV